MSVLDSRCSTSIPGTPVLAVWTERHRGGGWAPLPRNLQITHSFSRTQSYCHRHHSLPSTSGTRLGLSCGSSAAQLQRSRQLALSPGTSALHSPCRALGWNAQCGSDACGTAHVACVMCVLNVAWFHVPIHTHAGQERGTISDWGSAAGTMPGRQDMLPHPHTCPHITGRTAYTAKSGCCCCCCTLLGPSAQGLPRCPGMADCCCCCCSFPLPASAVVAAALAAARMPARRATPPRTCASELARPVAAV